MVSKKAGQFAGGFFNNPGTLALGALAIGLIFFAKPITNFLQNAVDNFKLPSLPDINFPDFNLDFPDINFPDIKFPDFNFPDFSFDFGDPLKAIQDSIDAITKDFENPLDPGRTPEEQPEIDVIPDFSGRGTRPDPTPDPLPPEVLNDPFFGDAELIRIQNEQEFRRRQDPIAEVMKNVQTAIDQTFKGGGVSFIGGSVSEIPLERLSLGQIIDRFDVSASKASSLRQEAIGFSPEEQAFLDLGRETNPFGIIDNTPQTSNQAFEGLTPQEIALRLTGGNINNF